MDPVNTKRDAFGIVFGTQSCKRTTDGYAERFATAYESKPSSRAGQMDLHNNAWGRTAGRAGKANPDGESDKQTSERCLDYISTQALIVCLDDSRID